MEVVYMAENLVKVRKLPRCQFCEKKATFDAKTVNGPWAYMCEEHFKKFTRGKLGLGIGQKLEAVEE